MPEPSIEKIRAELYAYDSWYEEAEKLQEELSEVYESINEYMEHLERQWRAVIANNDKAGIACAEAAHETARKMLIKGAKDD